MSVLIKDMEKPKSCYAVIDGEPKYCPFVNTDDDCVLQLEKGICEGTWADQYSKCPLIEAPESCEDAVSREAVSEWLKQYGQDVLHGKYKFSLMYIWKNLMDLPSAQPEQRWILVTDHLPDEDVPVLVTDDAGGMATVGIDSCGRYEDTGERFWYTSQNVTAWMYTVEPYRGEQE